MKTWLRDHPVLTTIGISIASMIALGVVFGALVPSGVGILIGLAYYFFLRPRENY